jgi:hypothetical protein
MMFFALLLRLQLIVIVVVVDLSSATSLGAADDTILGKLPEGCVVYAVGTYSGPKPIVPEGVPFPDGPRGHNEFYLMDGTKRDAFDFAREAAGRER